MGIFEPLTEKEFYGFLAEVAPAMKVPEAYGIVQELRGIGPQRKQFFLLAIRAWLEEKEKEKKKAGK